MLSPKRGKIAGFRDKSPEGIVGLKDMVIGILTDMGNVNAIEDERCR